jgi:hypothetical protein
MGAIEGNQLASDNDWESIKGRGRPAVKRWIDAQMVGKSVVIVLIGAKTATRSAVKYEIKKGWDDGKGVLGIHIHKLTDRHGNQSSKGASPFHNANGLNLHGIVKAYDPPVSTSKGAYSHISSNLAAWIEEAIEIRKLYK